MVPSCTMLIIVHWKRRADQHLFLLLVVLHQVGCLFVTRSAVNKSRSSLSGTPVLFPFLGNLSGVTSVILKPPSGSSVLNLYEMFQGKNTPHGNLDDSVLNLQNTNR